MKLLLIMEARVIGTYKILLILFQKQIYVTKTLRKRMFQKILFILSKWHIIPIYRIYRRMGLWRLP